MSAYYECECDNFDMTEGQDSFEMNEGIPGPGVPAGGSAGQVLRKTSGADYDTEWDTLTAGDVAFNKESGYVSGTVGRYLQLLDSEDVQYTYGGEKELGTVGETLDYLADKSVEIEEALDDLDDGLDDLKNTLNRKADVIYDTTSGDVASFPDGADGLPVKDLTVSIEPVQDLHGYDNPWPAGGGKNLFGGTISANTANELLSSSVTLNDGTYTLSFASSKTPGAVYVREGNTSSGTVIAYAYSVKAVTFTLLEQKEVCFTIYLNTGIVPSDISDVQIESGSFATSYAPYSNICPISGWTGCNISHSGADTSDPTVISISWQSEAGTVYGGTLELPSCVLTVDKKFALLNNPDKWVNSYAGTIQFGYDYDFNDRKTYSTSFEGAICSAFPFDGSKAVFARWAGASSGYFGVNGSISLNDIKSMASNGDIAILYELATPLTYQLTPTDVITTLLGQNNIWTDCGPSTVEYPCDTKLYIQKINTPTDDDMIADAQIASGQYFIVNNNLYLSTAAILAGDPIKPGTNCILTNLAAALNALNS